MFRCLLHHLQGDHCITRSKTICFLQCCYKVLTTKPTRCTNYSNLFLEWNSKCFGQFLCPSSGVFHCTRSNGICHTGLLAACEQDQDVQNQLDALITQIYFWNETLHVSDSSSVHHQEFFTVHTAMVYVMQVCWQLESRRICSCSQAVSCQI